MDAAESVRRGQSRAAEARAAAREFHDAVAQEAAALVVFFCSSSYDLGEMAEELNRLFSGVRLVGCTTSGEIGPAGYCDRSISGASFASSSFGAAVARFDELERFSMATAQAASRSLLRELELDNPGAGAENSFALLLVDGLSRKEEQVASALQSGLGKVRLFGGSAGDDQEYERSFVFCGGEFRSDAAVLALVTTELPFRIFMLQHFLRSEERFVVTGADPSRRTVLEINGLPAAPEYARLVGLPVEALDSEAFAAFPVLVLINGTEYVRSIQRINADRSITFYSAIEEGLVLRVARGRDILASLEEKIDELGAEIGPLQVLIACDCVLRKLEIAEKGLKPAVEALMVRSAAVGFNTYGEQIDGIHVNQTLTGIAIGFGQEGR